ncbi:MAG: CPBP family intramembrane metalloprotease domain-containing protein [Nioella sp.]|nr:CPBP family intramembrane metalloprotease domain-containing protein [Nioella sp.]
MTTKAHDAFIAPARARPQLWRLIVGLILVGVTSIAWFFTVVGVIYLVSGSGGPEWVARMARADTPTSTLLVLSMLFGLGLGAMLAARLLHGRGPDTLLGRRRRVIRHFAWATGVCAAVLIVSTLIPYGYQPLPGLDLNLWLSFLPLALVAILFQSGAEELLFRGYIQQQLAARFNSPLVWMLIPSLLFGAAHFDPNNPPILAWLIVAAAGIFGLCAADLTARTGSIGAAWGFHFANNVAAILIVALNGNLSGLALYVTPFGPQDAEILQPLILRDIATTVVIYAAIRMALSRRAA